MIPYINDRVSGTEDGAQVLSTGITASSAFNLFALPLDFLSNSLDMIPTSAPYLTNQVPTELRFRKLTSKWRRETMHLSSAADIAMHPAYQQIIGMGWAAVPPIMEELGNAPNHWFWALGAITGLDPVPAKDRGNLAAMARHWLKWWKNHIGN